MDRKRGKRPWLAALLGTLATGLGHFYLRRWRRGLAWFAAAVIVSYLFVPPEAAQALLSGEGSDPADLAPVFAVGIASIADAYVLARRRQQQARSEGTTRTADGAAGLNGDGRETGLAATATMGSDGPSVASDAESCPNCGKELDPELDFCPWCTTRLDTDDGRGE
ncbi:DUF7575 domain-containing protein [Halobellus rarus]|uniref:Zinc ribbon domain-containing protein n=1 Tax=Halobellus rarus TaxID=1126237 RepID=A0ABD6CJ71_9EURY|nr:zinc ribbon domain-containing protein [Halobellus rarus]